MGEREASSGGYYPIGTKRASGKREKGSRSGYNNKVEYKGPEVPVGEFRFCGVTRTAKNEYVLEDATAGL